MHRILGGIMEIDGKNFMEVGTLKIVLGQMGWIFADKLSDEVKDIYTSSHIVPLVPDFYKKGTVLAVSKKALILADGETEITYRDMKFTTVKDLCKHFGPSAIEDMDNWKFDVEMEWVVKKNGQWVTSFSNMYGCPFRTNIRC